MCALFDKLKKAFKSGSGSGGGQNKTTTSSSSSTTTTTTTTSTTNHERWGIARVAHHCVPCDVKSVAYDGVQGILALGTNNGLLHIYGKYGLDYTFYMDPIYSITCLEFVVNQGWLIGICVKITNRQLNEPPIEGYSLCIWSMRECALKYQIELNNINVKRMTCLHAPIGSDYCYVGIQRLDGSSCVRAVHVARGELSNTLILESHSTIQQQQQQQQQQPSSTLDTNNNYNNNNNNNINSCTIITCIETHPTLDQYLLVGYDTGHVVLFNILQHHVQKSAIIFRVNSCASVTSISWHPKGSFFFAATSSGDLTLWQFDAMREKQLNSNTSALYTQSDISFPYYKDLAYITDVYCMSQNVFVSIQSGVTISNDVCVSSEVESKPDQNTIIPSHSIDDGIYNLVFPPTWQEASMIQIINTCAHRLILMQTENPYKSEISSAVAFAGIITRDKSQFKVFSLQRESHNNTCLTIGNFLNEDNSNNNNNNNSDEIADVSIIEDAKFVERIFRSKRDVNRAVSFPLFGGDVDFTDASSTSSHLIAVRYTSGCANIWAVKSDTGALAKVHGIGNRYRKVTSIKVWSNEAFIIAYDNNTVDFLGTRSLRSFPLTLEPCSSTNVSTDKNDLPASTTATSITTTTNSNSEYLDSSLTEPITNIEEVSEISHPETSTTLPANRNITTIAPAQVLNRLVVGYDDGSVSVVELVSSDTTIVFSYNLSMNSDERVTSIEIAYIPLEKTGRHEVKHGWIAFVGLSSGQIIGVNIEQYEERRIEWKKKQKQSESVEFVPSDNKNECIALEVLDGELGTFPCVQPSDTDLPYFVQREMSLMNGPNHSITLGINSYTQGGIASNKIYVPPNLTLFDIDAKMGFVCPLVIELCMNPETGLRMMNGEVNVRLTSSEGHILFWAEVHPLKVKMGHLPHDAQLPSDLIEVEFDYDLENIALDGAKTVIITHDIAQKKYRIYNGGDLCGIRTYDQEPPPNTPLQDVQVSVNGTPPPKSTYDTHAEYVQDYVRSINLYYKKMVPVRDLNSSPDICCVWRDEVVRAAGLLVCLRKKSLQIFKIRNRGLKLLSQVEIKSTFISGKTTIIQERLVYVTLDKDATVRIFSLPDLQLYITKSLIQPHLFREVIPAAFCAAEENHLIFAAKEHLLQTCVIPTDVLNNYVIEPTFHLSNIPMPIRLVKQSNNSTTPQVVTQVLGGLQQLGGLLFGTNSSQQQQQQQQQFQQPSASFNPRVTELLFSSPQQISGVKEYERTEFEKQVFKNGNKRKLLPVYEPPRIKKPQDHPPQDRSALLNNTAAQPNRNAQPSASANSQDAKLARLLKPERATETGPNRDRSRLQQRTDETRNAMHENLQKLDERGQRLRNVEERSSDMALAAQNFAARAAQLKQQSKPFGFF